MADRRAADSKAIPCAIRGKQFVKHLEQAFGATSLILEGRATHRVSIIRFPVGPIGIAYPNFPIGLATAADIETCMRPKNIARMREAGVHLLRAPVSGLIEQQIDAPVRAHLPETVIVDLTKWSLGRLSKHIRRDVRLADRSGLQIVPATVEQHGKQIFELYSASVARHGGTRRYTEKYFYSLLNLTTNTPDLTCLVAETADRHMAGFILTADDDESTYYLHAAINMAYKKMCPADSLIATSIRSAQSRGLQRFNMLASPVDQPSLVRFKEKWGGQTVEQIHYDIEFVPLLGPALRTLDWLRALPKRRIVQNHKLTSS